MAEKNKCGNPNWEKGKSANPNGRPKGSTNPIRQQFQEALQTVEKAKKKKFLTHLCELAYEDPKVAIALAKKILPDLTENEIKTDQPIIVQIIDEYK